MSVVCFVRGGACADFALLTLTLVLDMVCLNRVRPNVSKCESSDNASPCWIGVYSACTLLFVATWTFFRLAPLSYGESDKELHLARARLSSTECWMNSNCWAASNSKYGSGSDSSRNQIETGQQRSTWSTSSEELQHGHQCLDNDALLAKVVDRPDFTCAMVAAAQMCNVLERTEAEYACTCSC